MIQEKAKTNALNKAEKFALTLNSIPFVLISNLMNKCGINENN